MQPTTLCFGTIERGGGAARGGMLVPLWHYCIMNQRGVAGGWVPCYVHHRALSSIEFSISEAQQEEGGGAVLQNFIVAMYITVYYHQSVRRSSRGGRGAVLRTSPCTYYHQSTSDGRRRLRSRKGREGALCYVYHRVLSSTISEA